MLIRKTGEPAWECVTQEHHALLSGLLAGAWAQSHIDPLVVSAITLHDAAWRDADAEPRLNPETGVPYDFVSYPYDDKIAFYQSGIDHLEEVHPYIAYMVSLHYTTFSGTRDEVRLQQPEAQRRERLEELIPGPLVSGSGRALEWVKFFDVFSLHLCLTGPEADSDWIPRWLTDSSTWSTAPDGTELELTWADDQTLEVTPWPFDKNVLSLSSYHRRLDKRAGSGEALDRQWHDTDLRVRSIHLRAGSM